MMCLSRVPPDELITGVSPHDDDKPADPTDGLVQHPDTTAPMHCSWRWTASHRPRGGHATLVLVLMAPLDRLDPRAPSTFDLRLRKYGCEAEGDMHLVGPSDRGVEISTANEQGPGVQSCVRGHWARPSGSPPAGRGLTCLGRGVSGQDERAVIGVPAVAGPVAPRRAPGSRAGAAR